MPTYTHRCDEGHEFDLVLRFSELDVPQFCSCGRPAARQISKPMIFVSPDICYDSPVDGRHITSKQARLEDLARNECIEYDPGMKQDYERRIADGEKALDRSVEQTVERVVSEMPARKREKLEAELRSGAAVEPVRITPEQQSARP